MGADQVLVDADQLVVGVGQLSRDADEDWVGADQ